MKNTLSWDTIVQYLPTKNRQNPSTTEKLGQKLFTPAFYDTEKTTNNRVEMLKSHITQRGA